MGFAETIEAAGSDERYKTYYLKYRALKEVVQQLAEDAATPPRTRLVSGDFLDANERPVGRFQELLQSELKKVNQFACIQHESLFLGLRRICEECKSLSRDQLRLEEMAARIEAASNDIVHLDTYVRLNYIGFQKLTQKFDIGFRVSGSALFIAGLHNEPFCNVRFDDIMILLGLAWARWRASQSAEQSKDATWKPPESFIRNTAKYFVKPDKVVLLKTRILRHLPYLIFGASVMDQEKLLEPFALLDLDYQGFDVQAAMNAYSGTLEESQLLSSVYFDSPDGVCYQERIRREEGARLARFRWYGENNQEPDKEIFVERKIHHEGWGGASSAKERCIVSQKDIFEFMKGRFDIDGYFSKLAQEGMYSEKTRKSMKIICKEVHQMIQEKRLQPILRTSYYRCAFQLSTSNEVRISLDTQMSLLNEFVEGGHMHEPWCHTSTDPLREDEVYRFPYAILEIKLQNVAENPLWLRHTLAETEAVQVHKFSKFQHGMAFLHPKRVPIMPHWHKDFADWHAKKAIAEDASAGSGVRLKGLFSSQEMDDLTVPKLEAVLAPGGEGHLLKDMDNLDPKAVFANERTLLHYAEKGIYAGAISVALMRQGGWLKAGGFLLSAAVAVFYVWSLSEYWDRLSRITGRSKVAKDRRLRLDWALGPTVVGVLITIMLGIILVHGVAITLEHRRF